MDQYWDESHFRLSNAHLKCLLTDLEIFSWFNEVFLEDVVESRVQILVHVFDQERPSHGEAVFQMGTEKLVVEGGRLKDTFWVQSTTQEKKKQ